MCSIAFAFAAWAVAEPGIVEMLPGRESSAHRRADEQVRSLLAENLAGLLALGPDVEVPGLAVVGVVHNDVEGEAGREELAFGPPDFRSDSRRRIELRDDRLGLEVSDTAQQLLRENVLLIRL